MVGEDNFVTTTTTAHGSLLSKQHQMRMETRRWVEQHLHLTESSCASVSVPHCHIIMQGL